MLDKTMRHKFIYSASNVLHHEGFGRNRLIYLYSLDEKDGVKIDLDLHSWIKGKNTLSYAKAINYAPKNPIYDSVLFVLDED